MVLSNCILSTRRRRRSGLCLSTPIGKGGMEEFGKCMRLYESLTEAQLDYFTWIQLDLHTYRDFANFHSYKYRLFKVRLSELTRRITQTNGVVRNNDIYQMLLSLTDPTCLSTWFLFHWISRDLCWSKLCKRCNQWQPIATISLKNEGTPDYCSGEMLLQTYC